MVIGNCTAHRGIKNSQTNYVTSQKNSVAKTLSININLWLYPQYVWPLIDPGILKSLICTSMKKRYMNFCFAASNWKQKTPEDTAGMSFFLMFDSNLQIRCRRIISKPSLRSKKSISLPPHILAFRSKMSNMKAWKKNVLNSTRKLSGSDICLIINY